MTSADDVARNVCPPLDRDLFLSLLNEYVSQEKRYRLRDWEPSTLDGGQFAEIGARVLYHQDSGTLNPTKEFDPCISYVENEAVHHCFAQRRQALHLARALRMIYKFRSQRGAIHIAPGYTANQMDARLVIECCRWVLSEFLRVFWIGDQVQIATVLREIASFEVPAVQEFEGRLLVQRTDLTTEEEILVLLYHRGEVGLPQSEIARCCLKDASGVSRALKSMRSGNKRLALQLGNGNYRLTDLGCKRVLEDLADKLFPG